MTRHQFFPACPPFVNTVYCVKVFSDEGQLLYEIGSKESREGQLKGPKGLAIDKRENLLYVITKTIDFNFFPLMENS